MADRRDGMLDATKQELYLWPEMGGKTKPE